MFWWPAQSRVVDPLVSKETLSASMAVKEVAVAVLGRWLLVLEVLAAVHIPQWVVKEAVEPCAAFSGSRQAYQEQTEYALQMLPAFLVLDASQPVGQLHHQTPGAPPYGLEADPEAYSSRRPLEMVLRVAVRRASSLLAK